MKIAVIGLGLMGGSLCMSLKRAGYFADGYDLCGATLEYALENKIINAAVCNTEIYDTVFVALPPQDTVNFIINSRFKSGAVVSDICGVKSFIEREVEKCFHNFNYIGLHPMAGKEVSGIQNACADLFDGASMVITHGANTDEGALQTIRKLTKELGFGYLVECSAQTHDRKIAYTSQLAHIVSNAYVKDADLDCCLGFTGGSFQDMTRIAGVDEDIWAELYLQNAENVSQKIESVISSLSEIKNAVDSGSRRELREILKQGRLLFEKGKKISDGKDIIVKKL